jgi:hypothetical protein
MMLRSIFDEIFVSWLVWSFFNAHWVIVNLKYACLRLLVLLTLCLYCIQCLLLCSEASLEIEDVVFYCTEWIIVRDIDSSSFSLLGCFIDLNNFWPFSRSFACCWLKGSPRCSIPWSRNRLWSILFLLVQLLRNWYHNSFIQVLTISRLVSLVLATHCDHLFTVFVITATGLETFLDIVLVFRRSGWNRNFVWSGLALRLSHSVVFAFLVFFWFLRLVKVRVKVECLFFNRLC